MLTHLYGVGIYVIIWIYKTYFYLNVYIALIAIYRLLVLNCMYIILVTDIIISMTSMFWLDLYHKYDRKFVIYLPNL